MPAAPGTRYGPPMTEENLAPAPPLVGEAADLARGIARLLHHMGFAALEEFNLANGRRADLFAIGRKGEIVVVEIKVSVADFKGDDKWPEYLAHCDRFYFGVPAAFPRDLVPAEVGLMIGDRYGAAVLRDAPERTMATRLRHRETHRFALYAAGRLRRTIDPEFG